MAIPVGQGTLGSAFLIRPRVILTSMDCALKKNLPQNASLTGLQGRLLKALEELVDGRQAVLRAPGHPEGHPWKGSNSAHHDTESSKGQAASFLHSPLRSMTTIALDGGLGSSLLCSLAPFPL